MIPSAPICYIDCSSFVHGLMVQESLLHPEVFIHIGDAPGEELVNIIGNASVVLNGHTYMTAELMDQCPALRSIVFLGTGASSYIDMNAAADRNITVHTIKGYGDQSIAEHTFALMLAAARGISHMDADIRRGVWEPATGFELRGATLGLIGAGGVGKTMAGIAQAFGMRILIYNRSPLEAPLDICQTDLITLLKNSDIISLHLGLNEQTRHFLGPDEFELMKPGSILVNTARGDLIDIEALIAALLKPDGLAHAALDVYNTEPLPATDPLLGLSNVTLSAHAAYKTSNAGTRLIRQGVEMALAQLKQSIL